MLMAGNLGGAAVVAVLGVLKDAQGSFSGGIALCVLLALVVVAVTATVPEPLRGRRRHQVSE
jgi:fucose permease